MGLIKLKCDVTVVDCCGVVAVAVVARDFEVLITNISIRRVEFFPSMGEALVVRTVMDLACRRGWDKVVCEGDCLPLIDALAFEW